ncbi:aminodeoxychorismate synthase component I [Helicovermis profundi]|uniref:aminodeoxychorismate synthase n=1 Tax=Helicovermis profundi TaxID=3065157 RepID=A0AAU9ECS1_9FIRM|nr:aminodeoxychorismate synthase component I [Clostridia bacterium S502]
MIIKEISTDLTSFELFSAFKDEKYPYFLDSSLINELGRYSFISCNPFLIFKSKDKAICIEDSLKNEHISGNPFDELNTLYKKYYKNYEIDLPFIGGGVGFFSYDLCHHLEKLPRRAIDDTNTPDLIFGFYDGGIVIDHIKKKTYITDAGINEGENDRVKWIEKRIKDFEENPISINPKKHRDKAIFNSNFTKEEYINAIKSIREYIRMGDIYQANMTQRFTTVLRDEPIELYKKLREKNPAPFACYFDFEEGKIISSSPERFISIREGMIETRPIKGTMPRGKNKKEDEKNRNILINSEKDKAELLMIVDLERNDLSRVAKTGSVKVPELFKVEEYATVFHLVATVRALVKDNLTPIDCLKYTFPGGSITGAPKIRSMEIIDELEPTSRNIYTGSIGYIGFNGETDLNIVIRTIVTKDDKAYFQVGGGITWGSIEKMEYQESLDKAKALMEALNE